MALFPRFGFLRACSVFSGKALIFFLCHSPFQVLLSAPDDSEVTVLWFITSSAQLMYERHDSPRCCVTLWNHRNHKQINLVYYLSSLNGEPEVSQHTSCHHSTSATMLRLRLITHLGLSWQGLTPMHVSLCLQNFFRSYKKLAGMTGTAATEASEFDNIYKLPVTVVPTNQKVRRTDESDVVFSQEEGVTPSLVFRLEVPSLFVNLKLSLEWLV